LAVNGTFFSVFVQKLAGNDQDQRQKVNNEVCKKARFPFFFHKKPLKTFKK